jgi:hypothetical protein
VPYVTTEPGAFDPKGSEPKSSGTARLLQDQRNRLDGEAWREKQIEYLASELSRIEKLLPTQEELEYLKGRTKDAQNFQWLRDKIRTFAPWMIPIAGAIGAAFVWFASNTINIVGKP